MNNLLQLASSADLLKTWVIMEQDNKWTAEMSSIPRINTEEYSNAYQNGFALVANKDKVFFTSSTSLTMSSFKN